MLRDVTATEEKSHRGRFLTFVVALIAGVAIVGSDSGRAVMGEVFEAADRLIAGHPRTGVFVFVGLSAMSAMLAFFSSAILLPVAIYAWGDRTTFVLLWLGWFLGGVTSYAIGKYLGRDVVLWVVPAERLHGYERRLAAQATFGRVLLFHLLVPSEMPGYVLGLLRYPFRRYVAVVALAEIPFAVGAIYLGSTFVEGNLPLFVILAAAAAGLSILTTRWFLRHGGDEPRPGRW
jgi:uncharacterized membrane protein YdjX (TVP38/TMEM64 family)